MNQEVQNHYIEVFDKYRNATPSGYWNNPTAYDTPPVDWAELYISFCSTADGDIFTGNVTADGNVVDVGHPNNGGGCSILDTPMGMNVVHTNY